MLRFIKFNCYTNRKKKNIKTEAKLMPSILSIIPPCPGIILPISFTPTLRLTKLSIKSPSSVITLPTTPAIIKNTNGEKKCTVSAMPRKTKYTIIPPTAPPTTPPIAPAIVLLGLSFGQSFFALPFLIVL